MTPEYLFEVSLGDVNDVYYVDLDMYGVPEQGAVYIIDADEPVVIDTGTGKNTDRIVRGLDSLGIDESDLSYIFPTHVHLDHAGGTSPLAETFPESTVLVHELGVAHLVDPSELVVGTKRALGGKGWEFYGEPTPIPSERIRTLSDGTTIDLGEQTLTAHHAPGHANHQFVLHNPENDLVFTADAAGYFESSTESLRAVCPPPEFDLEKSLESLDTIESLDPSVLCYAHFGPARPGDKLDRYGATLEEWVDLVAERRAELGDDTAVVESFQKSEETAPYSPDIPEVDTTVMNVQGALRYLDQPTHRAF
jgi:glyoxylase-like metal-dependent hydrolase (beta-lactamase superfamily II)